MEYNNTNNNLLLQIITLFEITIYKYLKDKDIEGLLYGQLNNNNCRKDQEEEEYQKDQGDEESGEEY